MAKDFVKTFIRLCNYLQDPCHVARFQNLCGIKGAFPDKRVKADDELLSNGACGGARETVDRDYPLQRNIAAARRREQSDDSTVIANGTAVSESSETGDVVITRADGGGDQARPVDNVDSTDRAKPLRRNSLTGDVGQEFIIHNKFLFYLFTFGTELGNEMFFIIFFPFLFWNVDALVSRRLIVVWAWNLFFGQSTKDLVRWSRPASPPVVKVEVFYNSEYSMPSTHAMTGTAIPFCVFFLSYERWQYPFLLGLSVAVCWSFLVCISRVYMGMHSILEVITGSLYTLLILAVLLPVLDQIDTFYMTSHHAPLAIIVVHIGLGLVAFSLDSWSTSRGDTAQGLATAAGAALATHVNHQLGLSLDLPLSAMPLALPAVSATLLLRSLLRFTIGVAVLLVTRMVMKALTIPFLCGVFRLPSGNVRQARQHMRVELPYRYIVYSVVGFSCVCLVPLLFSFFNLS